MKTPYLELVQRIRGEIPDFERVINRALRAWSQVEKKSDEYDVYLDSVALNLQSFYSGLERIFELIARHIDHAIPTGETWHRDLLHQMSLDVVDIRPALISQKSALILDEFRRFRHLVRNVYTMNLAPDKMYGLITSLDELWNKLRAELGAFADFLEELAEATEEK